jgi:hypothetical protein
MKASMRGLLSIDEPHRHAAVLLAGTKFWLAVILLAAACGNDVGAKPDAATGPDWSQPQTFSFGPYHLDPSQEVTDDCVQITLNNDADIYINAVELTTGAGFHHSNWVWVPEGVFHGPNWNGFNSSVDDGTFKCADRAFDQAIAVIKGGGVLFAQSTQSAHDVQQFAPGVVIHIPPHSKIMSTIHLLDSGDTALDLSPTIKLTPIAQAQVTTQLAGMSFENHALGLPPMMQSSFAVECDLTKPPTGAQWPPVNFKVYYALAHYHAMGTAMTIEAIKADNTATTIFTTTAQVGDALGGPLVPQFDMTGYARLRFTCQYYNNTAATVVWGNGGEEMCVFLAFSDSPDNWGGGVPQDTNPGTGTPVGGVMTFTHACDQIFANPAN